MTGLEAGAVERLAGESDNEYLRRLCRNQREQRRQALIEARARAAEEGKEPFHEARFRQAYLGVKSVCPDSERLEEEYYLDYRSVRTLEEFIQAVFQTDLYDGGDMHLDP